MVKTVYWHQLIAPGYGLIDNREGKIIKRSAYLAFKTMLSMLQNSKIISFVQHKFFYEIIAEQNDEFIQVLWCNNSTFELTFKTEVEVISRDGVVSQNKVVKLSDIPVYIRGNHES
jgi:hypothetical protein